MHTNMPILLLIFSANLQWIQRNLWRSHRGSAEGGEVRQQTWNKYIEIILRWDIIGVSTFFEKTSCNGGGSGYIIFKSIRQLA